MIDRLEVILLGITIFLFYMTFYTLYGYKVEKSVIRRIKEYLEELSKELGLEFKNLSTKAVRLGRHIVIIEPAPRYNPIVTRAMKRRGTLKEFIYVQTRNLPREEILFIPKSQKRLLSKYAGLIAQLEKVDLIHGIVSASKDARLLEKIIRRNKDVFSRMAGLAEYIRYIYLEGGELESSFALDLEKIKIFRELMRLHIDLVRVFERELSRDFSYSLSSLR